MKARILRTAREPLEELLIVDALNDAVEKVWMRIATANLSAFVNGPVQSLTLNAGDERGRLITIADPTTAPIWDAADVPVFSDTLIRSGPLGPSYVAGSGPFTFDAGGAHGDGLSAIAVLAGAAITDASAQIEIPHYDTTVGNLSLYLRFTGTPLLPTNYYQAIIAPGATRLTINKNVAGAITNIASLPILTIPDGSVLRFEAVGTNLNVYLNGAAVLNVVDASLLAGNVAFLPVITDVSRFVGSIAANFNRQVVAGYTFVTESGSETLMSPTATIGLVAGTAGVLAAPAFVENAIGWNVYAGDKSSRMALQNAVPIDFNSSWTEPDGGVIDEPGLPSPPTANGTADDVVSIKTIQVQNPDGRWQTWEGAALESLTMKRLGHSLAVNSTYQNHCFDLINGDTLEIRPPMGQTTIPRMFYVKKARRLRYDSSILPFQNFSGAIETIGDYAMSKLKLSLEEFAAAESWAQSAAAGMSDLTVQANEQNVTRIKRITPYMR